MIIYLVIVNKPMYFYFKEAKKVIEKKNYLCNFKRCHYSINTLEKAKEAAEKLDTKTAQYNKDGIESSAEYNKKLYEIFK